MPKRKKSKYKHILINKKRYYFYKIHWIDITGDAGHATMRGAKLYTNNDARPPLQQCTHLYDNVSRPPPSDECYERIWRGPDRY